MWRLPNLVSQLEGLGRWTWQRAMCSSTTTTIGMDAKEGLLQRESRLPLQRPHNALVIGLVPMQVAPRLEGL